MPGRSSLALSIVGAVACLLVVPRAARAANPAGGCTQGSHAAACNHDGTSPCSGICLPDYTQPDVPMLCFPADTPVTAISGYTVKGVEGFACSPTGAAGTDCTHSCRSGECVAQAAMAATECVPDGGTNVCEGMCGDAGTCSGMLYLISTYGLDKGACTFTACNPVDVITESGQTPLPKGWPCEFADNPCLVDTVCNGDGSCGGTAVPDCIEPMGDGGATGTEDGGDEHDDMDAGLATTKKMDAAATTPSDAAGAGAGTARSSSCSMGTASGNAPFALLATLVACGLALPRRRRRS